MKKSEMTSVQDAQMGKQASASPSLNGECTTAQFMSDDLMTLIGQARRGDEQAAQNVMRKLRERPSIERDLCKAMGDMGQIAWQQWAAAIGKEDVLQRECVLQQASMLRSEVAGVNPTPLEQLLADRVALCSVQLNYFEALLANNLGDDEIFTRIQGRVAHANHQLLAAIKILATVRRLLIPAMQVNIAAQQNNTMNSGFPKE